MKPRQVVLLLLGLFTFLVAASFLIKRPRPELAPPRLHPLFSPRRPGESEPVEPSPAPQPAEARKSRAKAVKVAKVNHQPPQPKTGEPVLITADFKELAAPGQLLLEYQVVEPGKYLALHDSAFEKQWTSLRMTDRGNQAFEVQLPASLQKHRRLIRYRIRSAADHKIVAPSTEDAQPNFAYFVYDGVPAWKGAINPHSQESALREPVTFPSQALQRVPVYHFISSQSAVENATWSQTDQFGGRDRHAYKYTGTMVYDGVVYDHIGFRARGGSWRHAMGKNMWKFNFLPGHRFEARDHYGRRYEAKWDKLNLGACIQQGDYGMRGEQGMFEAVGFRLFNLAGIEASRTHWVHLRIIDQAEENPPDQYAGDFWGLYLAVENVDEHFLKEHGLPPGNLYKMEFGAKTSFNGNPAVTDQSDVKAFMHGLMRRQQPDSWWTENTDLVRYYDYRAILECIHHYDIDAGKNYFYYQNPKTRQWITIPWDIDLTWSDRMFGGGHEPFYRAGLLSRPAFKYQYQERLAEIRDLLFNPEEMGKLIDEHATMIAEPAGRPSLADADRAKWDYNPIMSSAHVFPMKAGPGRFYFGDPHKSFGTMVAYMKSYASKRANWIDSRLLADYQPPPAAKISPPPQFDFAAPHLSLSLEAKPEGTVSSQWRLAEITDTKSPVFDPHQPWSYEIQALWEQELKGSTTVSVPTRSLVPGHTYRVRARWQDADEHWSRWSTPLQFTLPTR